jgi:hypothetical protein
MNRALVVIIKYSLPGGLVLLAIAITYIALLGLGHWYMLLAPLGMIGNGINFTRHVRKYGTPIATPKHAAQPSVK